MIRVVHDVLETAIITISLAGIGIIVWCLPGLIGMQRYRRYWHSDIPGRKPRKKKQEAANAQKR